MKPGHYGLSEIAEALDVERNTVAQWRIRGKLPPADDYLAQGPVWDAKTIEPWIRARKKRLEEGWE